VRAHGVEFYLRKLIHITEKDADIVMPLNPEQQARIIEDGEKCAELFKRRPAYGIIRSRSFERYYAPLGWTMLGQSGDFVLVGNAELLARDSAVLHQR
jgi:hypothetical protein